VFSSIKNSIAALIRLNNLNGALNLKTVLCSLFAVVAERWCTRTIFHVFMTAQLCHSSSADLYMDTPELFRTLLIYYGSHLSVQIVLQ